MEYVSQIPTTFGLTFWMPLVIYFVVISVAGWCNYRWKTLVGIIATIVGSFLLTMHSISEVERKALIYQPVTATRMVAQPYAGEFRYGSPTFSAPHGLTSYLLDDGSGYTYTQVCQTLCILPPKIQLYRVIKSPS